jgi:hypothetical protein
MQHLDEGTIHAWLDGQLPREEAQQVEAHVAECRHCADAVAEARGLIAASSRILTALDNVPGDVVPLATAPRAEAPPAQTSGAGQVTPIGGAAGRARRRWFNGVTLTAAATIVVAIGTTMLMRTSHKEMLDVAERSRPTVASARRTDSMPVAVSAPSVAPTPASVPAPEPPKALGAAGQPAEQRFAAVAPANEVARDASRPTDSAARTVTVTRARVVPPIDSTTRAKSATDLSKDAKAERPQNVAAAPPPPVPAGAPPAQIRLRGSNALRLDSTAGVAAQGAVVVSTGGAVRGRVTDANNTGLSDAMVTVVGTNIGALTNAAGEYMVGGLTSGAHRLLVRRIGYDTTSREVTVSAGKASISDIVLRPAQMTLSEVVTTGTAASQNAPARKAAADRAPAIETPPGAPITATQSNAVGCYELGITATTAATAARNGFRQVPRRVALDAEIVPANADGVWYRARDLARTASVPNGLWRPSGPDAIEIEWTYGSRTARIRVAGPVGSMMRGTLEEIDRATATGEAATVVAVRRSCAP